MLIVRLLALALVAIAVALAHGDAPDRDTLAALAACGAGAAAQIALWLAPRRWPRRLRLCTDVGIAVDVAWVAGVTAATGGISGQGPLLFLVMSLVAALGYSARTGLKAAVLSTIAYLLLAWGTPASTWSAASVEWLALFWAVLTLSILGAAAGERELRLRAERLEALHDATAGLLMAEGAAMHGIAEAAARRIMRGWRASVRPGRGVGEPTVLREGSEGVVLVPVPGPDGPVATLECRRATPRRGHRVRARELDALETIATSLGGALWRADLLERLERLSLTDSLTGLPNRRAFDDELARAIARAGDAGSEVALCLLDVDHFKEYNDTLGHRAGDTALAAVGAALAASARRGDVAARYGGEEFALILPATGRDVALGVAERVRAAIADTHIPTGGVTVSIGVASTDGTCSAELLVEAADRALYASKRDGRNRVSSEPPVTDPGAAPVQATAEPG